MNQSKLAAAVTALGFCAVTGIAQESESGGQSLGQAAEDPTASLMSLQIADWFNASFYHLPGDESANTVVLRPVIPFRTGEMSHIFRATIPFLTDHPRLDSGLSDVTFFDLVVFNEDWGRWGLGPVALLPTGGDDRGVNEWALGPAIGFTARQDKLIWGLFNQNLFNIGGENVNASVIQSIVNYGLGNGWSIGSSEMSFTWDWEAERWSSLPLGAKISKLQKFGEFPVQFSLQYEHDFAEATVGPEDTIRFTLKLLFPK